MPFGRHDATGSPRFLTAALLLAIAALTAIGTPARAQDDMPLDQIIATLKKSIRDKNDPMRNRMFFKLRALDKKAVPALVDLLKLNEPGVPEYAAFTLGWIADPSSVSPIVQFLDRGNTSQKKAALHALGNMAWGTKEDVRKAVHANAVESMLPYLKSEDVIVQREAAFGLGLAGDKRAIEPLRALKDSPNKLVRFLAEEAIARIESVNRPKKKG